MWMVPGLTGRECRPGMPHSAQIAWVERSRDPVAVGLFESPQQARNPSP